MKILCTRTNRNLWFIVENNDVEDGVHPIGYESYKKADEIAKLLQRHEKLDEYEILSQKELVEERNYLYRQNKEKNPDNYYHPMDDMMDEILNN